MSVLGALAWTVAGVQALAALPFLIEVGAGLLPARRSPDHAGSPLPATAVLMPAHDEAAHLGRVLGALGRAMPPAMRLLVVADNCADATAAVARAHGAETIERHDPLRRGKGYALAFGRDHLALDPPAVVIVLDADCRVEAGALERLADRAARTGAVIQSLYLLAPDLTAPAMVQVSNFAFVVKNLVRQRGLRRLGAPIPLGGTGMAFPWALFRDATLASDHLVEDLALSVDLALAGAPARYDEGAVVWSDAASVSATAGQRARWEGGFLQTARTHGGRLIAAGLARRRPGLVWMALHIATPPLALLMTAELAAAVLAGLLSRLAWSGAALLSCATVAALVLAVLAAWATQGWRWLRLGTLVRLPLYLAWKLPLYLRLVRGRGPKGWVRTEREG